MVARERADHTRPTISVATAPHSSYIVVIKQSALVMPVSHRRVFSSHIDRVGYDAAAGELHITYNTGRVAIYSGVPPGVAAKVDGAVSIGSAMYEHVRGRYPHRYEDA
jgi:hypothetical protein